MKDVDTFTGKPKRVWHPGEPVPLRPIYRIGKFFAMLAPAMKKKAKELSKKAGRMAKPDIIKAVAKLERSIQYNNIAS